MKFISLLSLVIICSCCSKYELTDVRLEEDPATTLSAYFIVGTTPQVSVYQTYQRGKTPIKMPVTEIKLYRNDSLIVTDKTGNLKDYPEATINYGQRYHIEITTSNGTKLSGGIASARQVNIERLSRDTVQEKDGSYSILYTYFLDLNNPQFDQLPIAYAGIFIDSLFRPFDSSYTGRHYEGEWTKVVPDPIFNLHNNDLAFLDGTFKDTLRFKAPFNSFIGYKAENAVHTLTVMSPILITQYNLTKDLNYNLEEYYHVPVVPTNVEGGGGIITEYTTYTFK